MKKNAGFWRGVITLLCITVLSGTLLSFVYEITKEPIAQAEAEAKEAAYRNVYPTAATFEEPDNAAERMEQAMAEFPALGLDRVKVEDPLCVLDADGQLIGFVLCATSPNGYGGDIKIALGISKDGVIQGFEPLSHGESPGYGANCEDPNYRASFAGKNDAAQVEGISGATYTTNAIREAVAAAMITVERYLQ